ncbi:hypothetical protein PoB_003999600 [Plakobranchus ocellatus]|uniref:Uncharacterized protein n=1 Tax=Plakobranchus ocellatus TaxID=259542 RepID=A0AAV4AYY2_9GAST|nr:hypothetical protein PoB_003999600 [Plakobranchus ocellatus]
MPAGTSLALMVCSRRGQSQLALKYRETDVKTCDDTALKAKSENLAVSTEDMDKLKSELRSELLEIKQEMLTEIHEVKLELNQKLDSILHLLQNLKSVKEKT